MRKQFIASLALVLGLGFGASVDAQSKKAPRKSVPASKIQPAKGGVRINGTLPDDSFDGEEVVLVRMKSEGFDTIAKAPIKGNKFAFTQTFEQDTTAVAELIFKRKFRTAVAFQNGTVLADLSTASATGTPLNDRFAKLIKDSKTLETSTKERFEAAKTDDEKNSIYSKYQADRLKLYEDAYKANLNNTIGARAAAYLFLGHNGATIEQIMQWRASASPVVLANPQVARTLKALDAEIATSAGKPFIDVLGKNDDGQPSKLSDFAGRGHYTLVDFWASWCGPCRRAMPGLKNIYAKYKDKGLQIVGLAVWDKWQEHLDAVKKDELPWPQIFNETEATDAYGVTGIPQILLIGPDGKIVARNLHGEESITALLEGILQKEGKL